MSELREKNQKIHGLSEDPRVLYEESETSEFQGIMESRIGKQLVYEEKIDFNPYTRLSGIKVSKPESIEMVYVSPTDHTNGNVFSRIVKNDAYPIECIKHKKLGIMPLSTYGDGIKKVLLLANSISRSAGGILLVDEIETAIHSRHYDDIFRFIIKACQQFNIQLFATTYSIEAVDGFLATQYDGENDIYDPRNENLIRVITFRKNDEKDKTDARVLKGEEVFNNRKNFEFEVRL